MGIMDKNERRFLLRWRMEKGGGKRRPIGSYVCLEEVVWNCVSEESFTKMIKTRENVPCRGIMYQSIGKALRIMENPGIISINKR